MPERKATSLVTIVGAGFSGIAVAIELKRAGINDFVILERSADVGGVWRDNSYPGCRCDIPSSLYSLSYAQKPDWQDHYASQPEIWRYLRSVAQRFDILRHVEFETDVSRCAWIPEQRQWLIETANRNPRTSRLLVNATGALNEPLFPKFAANGAFAGTTFHSSQWPAQFSPKDRRIAVVGTGASAVQLVPQIAPAAATVSVFQRTPGWIVPRNDHAVSATWKFMRGIAVARDAERAAQFARREILSSWFARSSRAMSAVKTTASRHLASQVADRHLRSKLQPDYQVGCKRILASDDWYPTLQRDNVDLVTDPIVDMTSSGLRTQSNSGSTTTHDVDTVIFATGFAVNRLPFLFRIYDRSGRSLARHWASSGPSAYLGTTVSGFPNLAVMTGPNTGLAANSMLIMIESQARYVRQLATMLSEDSTLALDVRPSVQRDYQSMVDTRLNGSVWTADACTSWYQSGAGKVTALWPGTTSEFRRRTRTLNRGDYHAV